MSDIKETIEKIVRVEKKDPQSGELIIVIIDGNETHISVGDQPALLLGTDQLGTLVHMACRGMALVEEK